MNRLSVLFLIVLLGIGFGFISCSEDDGGPAGSTLSAPQNLTAVAESASSISLTWTSGEAVVSGFRLERSPEGGAEWTQIIELNQNTLTWVDAGLEEAAAYSYRVKSFTASAESPYSGVVAATTKLKAPSRLSAVAASGTEIALSWTDNSSVEEGLEIQRSTVSGTGFESIITLSADEVEYTDSGLETNTTYYYHVRAVKGEIYSNWSSEVNAITTSAPENLVAEPLSDNSILLTWGDNSPIGSGFSIERSPVDEDNWQSVVRLLEYVTTYTDMNLSEGVSLRYRVKSFLGAVASTWSNEASATTLAKAPSRLRVGDDTGNYVGLTWNDNSRIEEAFEVHRAEAEEGPFELLTTLEAEIETYQDHDIQGNTTYFYMVRAMNSGQGSVWTDVVSAVTAASPSNLVIETRGHDMIQLTWEDNSDQESGIRIQREDENSGNWRQLIELGANMTTHTDTRLLEGRQYNYRVASFTETTVSPFSNEAQTQTYPIQPSAFSAERAGETEILLQWTDNSGVEDGYEIQRSLSADAGFETVLTTEANTATYTDTALTVSTTYYYKIRAANEGMPSPWSQVVSAETTILRPDAPSDLGIEPVGPYEVRASWVDNSDDEQGFRIERSANPDSNWVIIASIRQPGVQEHLISGLMQNTTYYFRIHAYNNFGRSDNSNVVEVTTPPGPPEAPTNLLGEALDHRRVSLSWVDHANNEHGFLIQRKDAEDIWEDLITIDPDILSYIDETVESRLTYYYRVRAFNDLGFSAWSGERTVQVPDAPIYSPVDLAATPLSMQSIGLSWTIRSNNEDGFKVERRGGGVEEFEEIQDLGENVNDFIDNGLERNTQYEYRVKAYFTNINGNYFESGYTNEDAATTYDDIEDPVNLIVSATGMSSLLVVWQSPAFFDGIRVERSLADQNDFQVVAEVDTNFHHDTGLEPETSYDYRVLAFTDYFGEEIVSEYSNVGSGTTFGEVAFFDDFESYDLNEPPDNEAYTIAVAGDSWVRVMDEDPHEADKGLKFNDPGEAGSFVQMILATDPVLYGIVSFWVKMAPDGYFGVIGADPQNLITFQIQYANDNTFMVRNGANLEAGGDAYPVDEWVFVQIDFNVPDGTWRLLFNEEVVVDGLQLQRPDFESNTQIVFVCFNDVAIDHVYMDELEVRRTVPEERMFFVDPAFNGLHRDGIKVSDFLRTR